MGSVVVGDKHGSLGIWVPARDYIEVTQPHSPSLPLSCLTFNSKGTLASSSYDGTVRTLDVDGGGSFVESLRIDARVQDITWIDDASMIACDSDGFVHVWDVRSGNLVTTAELHDKKINTVSIHESMLVTASLDRSVGIWDMRKLAGKGRKRKLVTEIVKPLSVNAARLSPDGSKLAVLWRDSLDVRDSSSKW